MEEIAIFRAVTHYASCVDGGKVISSQRVGGGGGTSWVRCYSEYECDTNLGAGGENFSDELAHFKLVWSLQQRQRKILFQSNVFLKVSVFNNELRASWSKISLLNSTVAKCVNTCVFVCPQSPCACVCVCVCVYVCIYACMLLCMIRSLVGFCSCFVLLFKVVLACYN